MISALEKIPVKQNIALTGEISLQGKIKAVGGIREKIYGAHQAEVEEVLIPHENGTDFRLDKMMKVTMVEDIDEVLNCILIDRL